MGYLRYYLLFSLLLCAVSIQAIGSSSDTDSVQASWKSLKSAAATAEIRFLKTTMTIEESNLTPEQVAEVVHGLVAEPGTELFSEIIHKLNPALEQRFAEHDQKQQPWSLWDDRTLYFDGFSERTIGENDEHLRTQNVHLVHNFKSRGIDCYELGQCPFFYYGLDWLIGIPAPRLLDEATVSETGPSDLKLDLENGKQIVVDAESHLPIYEESVDPDGTVNKVTFFRDQTSYPGGVSLPAVKIQVGFKNGIAKHVMMSAILDAKFNVEIDETKFEMPVSAGSNLTDLRSGERRSKRSKKDVSNAAEYFVASETQARPLAAPAGDKGFDWKSFLLIANGVFLIVLGFIVWKKSK